MLKSFSSCIKILLTLLIYDLWFSDLVLDLWICFLYLWYSNASARLYFNFLEQVNTCTINDNGAYSKNYWFRIFQTTWRAAPVQVQTGYSTLQSIRATLMVRRWMSDTQVAAKNNWTRCCSTITTGPPHVLLILV